MGFTQVCDSDTMLDPASSVEMVKVLEEDPMVGGVGGDVQVSYKSLNISLFLASANFLYKLSLSYQSHLSCSNSYPDPEQVRVVDLLLEQCTVLDGLQH